nr:hypothetical protein OG999_20825 [Streptomyces sp. NBC_00886]
MWLAQAQEGGLGKWFAGFASLYFIGVGFLLLVDPGQRGTRLMRRFYARGPFRTPDAQGTRRLSRFLGSGFLVFGLTFGVLLIAGLIS